MTHADVAHMRKPGRRSGKSKHGGEDLLRTAVVENHGVLTVEGVLVHAAELRQQRHGAAGHGLQTGAPKGLVGGGVDEDVGTAHERRNLHSAEQPEVGDPVPVPNSSPVPEKLGKSIMSATEGADANPVGERMSNPGKRTQSGKRPATRSAGPYHGGDAQNPALPCPPAGMKQLAIEAGSDLGHLHPVNDAEEIAKPVGLGEEQEIGQGAVGEQGTIRARGQRRGKERLVVLHVVGTEDPRTLKGQTSKQVHGGILGGDDDIGIGDRREEARRREGVADPGKTGIPRRIGHEKPVILAIEGTGDGKRIPRHADPRAHTEAPQPAGLLDKRVRTAGPLGGKPGKQVGDGGQNPRPEPLRPGPAPPARVRKPMRGDRRAGPQLAEAGTNGRWGRLGMQGGGDGRSESNRLDPL
jgi:hypothetical protein